jgi:hypothetical protein
MAISGDTKQLFTYISDEFSGVATVAQIYH